MLPERMIDFHAHIWGDQTNMQPRQKDLADLRDMADRYHIEQVVVMPLFGGLHPTPEQMAAGNDAAFAYAKEDKRMRPFVTVYPRHGQSAEDEVRRRMEEQGFAGMKIWVSPADEPCVFPLIERMIAYGKPTLIHAMHKTVGQYELESDPLQIANLARRYPEATIVMAHMGGNFLYGCGAIRDTPNVLTDPSGTYCETGMLEHGVRELGAQRIVFGSDAPGVDYLNNVAKVMTADISDADITAIMYDNARRLLS